MPNLIRYDWTYTEATRPASWRGLSENSDRVSPLFNHGPEVTHCHVRLPHPQTGRPAGGVGVPLHRMRMFALVVRSDIRGVWTPEFNYRLPLRQQPGATYTQPPFPTRRRIHAPLILPRSNSYKAPLATRTRLIEGRNPSSKRPPCSDCRRTLVVSHWHKRKSTLIPPTPFHDSLIPTS